MLSGLASIPSGPKSAIFFVGLISCAVSYINWGFGLVIGALVAKEVAIKKRGLGIHYPLLTAAVYGGNVLRGPSSAIPLAIATPGHFLEKVCGIIPVTDTLFSNWNMFITVFLFFAIPAVCTMLVPGKDDEFPPVELDPRIIEEELNKKTNPVRVEADSPAQKLDNSIILTLIVVAMALCWGDSWTNQIQPFWALTILAIAGLGVHDIMGYCLSIAVLVGVFISAVLAFV